MIGYKKYASLVCSIAAIGADRPMITQFSECSPTRSVGYGGYKGCVSFDTYKARKYYLFCLIFDKQQE